MNFYQSVLLEKNFLENISKKDAFWGNYPLIFIPFLIKPVTPKIIFKNLDYICHKSVGLQNKSKTFEILVIFLLETW